MIKAIFFDLDGTLISFKTHKVPTSAVKVISQLRQMGIKIFTATGRHKSTMKDLNDINFDGYVTLNGGICIVDDQVIYKNNLPQSDIYSLIYYLKNVEPFPCVFVEANDMFMNFRNNATDQIFELLNFSDIPIGDMDNLKNKVIFQLLAFLDKDQEEQIMKLLPGCKTTRWNPIFTDIVSKESDKWVGITTMLDYFHISPEETMVFGDGGNDINMIKNAGVGIAMGNADEVVKSVADYVTENVENDGILKAINHFKLLPDGD